MRSGELAARAGVNPQTLRYYERRGLLPEPARTATGYRVYDGGALRRLAFIRRAQRVGFSLAEIEVLLHLAPDRSADCRDARAMAQQKVGDIDRQMEDLLAIRQTLVELEEQCATAQPPEGCPMLRGFGDSVG